jgi:hypothetical protein
MDLGVSIWNNMRSQDTGRNSKKRFLIFRRPGIARQVHGLEFLPCQVLKMIRPKDRLFRQFAGAVPFILFYCTVVVVSPYLKPLVPFFVRMIHLIVPPKEGVVLLEADKTVAAAVPIVVVRQQRHLAAAPI